MKKFVQLQELQPFKWDKQKNSYISIACNDGSTISLFACKLDN